MTTPTRRSWWLTIMVSLAFLLALSIAACGGDDGDSGGGNATRTTAASATEDSGGDDDDEAGPTETDGSSGDAGDGSDDGGESPFDVCGLLTEDEVASVLGNDPGAGEPSNFDPFFDCQWLTEEFDNVSISVAKRDVGESLYNLDLDDETDPEDIDGLGDEAHYLGGLLPLLEVLEGDWYFSISLSEDSIEGDDATRDAMVGLARKAVDRLP